jgi:hypothetical protein
LQKIVDPFHKLHDEIQTDEHGEDKGKYFDESAENVEGQNLHKAIMGDHRPKIMCVSSCPSRAAAAVPVDDHVFTRRDVEGAEVAR